MNKNTAISIPKCSASSKWPQPYHEGQQYYSSTCRVYAKVQCNLKWASPLQTQQPCSALETGRVSRSLRLHVTRKGQALLMARICLAAYSSQEYIENFHTLYASSLTENHVETLWVHAGAGGPGLDS